VSDVVMPRLSDSMEEGTILKWLVSSGDTVSRGDEIVEIETDKANMTYEADASGVLEIVASEGDTLPIGELIARIGGDGAAPTPTAADVPLQPAAEPPAEAPAPAPTAGDVPLQPAAEPPAEAPAAASPAAAAPAPAPSRPAADAPAPSPAQPAAAAPADADGGARVKASPVARRLARELGVDLRSVQGTGPHGRIVKADVEARASGAAPAAPTPAAAATPAAAPAPVPGPVVSGEAGTGKGEARAVELNRTQQTIARRMAETKATVPDFIVTTEVDMAQAVAMRDQLKAIATEQEPAPSYNDMVVKACAMALREFPRVNGSYKDGRWELYARVNVGVAVAAPESLVVPTVFDADQKSLGEIGRETRALAQRVRASQITPPELSGGTFTVSNLGMFGVTEFTAIINAGQAAILSVGALRDEPVVRDGAVVPGKRMALTLACDHRILYGADAAEFLRRVRALLEAPLALAL
jgi:pyruvate dehydrogenase E2 component (dihydrolipoamide acetyltransferase)